MRHLEEPKRKVYFLTMEGLLFEVNVESLEAKKLFDLTQELNLPAGSQPHFKSAHTAQGRVVAANNTYEEPEYLGKRAAGRLAEWDGEGEWRIIEENPFQMGSSLSASNINYDLIRRNCTLKRLEEMARQLENLHSGSR